MANEKKMDQVILGFLNHEPMTGYEIKKRIDSTLKFFWSGSYGSIYPTLKSLERDGLVTKENIKTGGREKILYSITERGREYLKKWLLDNAARNELHYETLLKLFFGKEAGIENALKQIEIFENDIRTELKYLEMCVEELKTIQQNTDHKYFIITAMFGVEAYKGYLKWCKEAKDILRN